MVLMSSGSAPLDLLLEGGFEQDIITTIYGPSGSGKSNIVMVAVAQALRSGKLVVFIDTEASFSVGRVQQLLPDFKQYASQIKFLKPTTFEEQKGAFEVLYKLVFDDAQQQVGLIVVDSIAMLYRLEAGMTSDVYATNRELGIQLGRLTEITRKKRIPVLLTNQVYADFENKNNVHMVGGDLLKYSSKCLIELRKFKGGVRTASIVKHRFLPEGKTVAFRIVNEGLVGVELEDVRPVENAYEL